MKVCWTVDFEEEFDEEIIEHICDRVNYNNKQDDDDYIREQIHNEVCGWDDYVYYNWGEEQTDEVLKEVKRRLGGIQMKMDLGKLE